MPSRYVFDTGALYLYLADDKKATEPIRGVADGRAEGYTCETNLAELYHKTCEKLGKDAALIRFTSLRRGPIVVVSR